MVTIKQGHNIDVLRSLPEKSVHTCITSPPYWGLRDYGVPPSVWGGNADCKHEWKEDRYYTEKTAAKSSSDAFHEAGEENAARLKEGRWRNDSTCKHCNAWLGCHGLEPTPELFVKHEVLIFREVWRVLRDDGTLWVNLGDSYSANAGQRKVTDKAGIKQQSNVASAGAPSRCVPALGAKQLIGIPWRVAFALQADGWILRSDIIWHKPNPMPESVTDRPTKAHEYIFLLSKSERYYYDADAIKEAVTGTAHARGDGVNPKAKTPGVNSRMFQDRDPAHPKARKIKQNESFSAAVSGLVNERNKRSVWSVATAPYRGAHFATFPPNLIRPCVLAGCPIGGTVLDIFGGSGTTGAVAEEEGRNSILIELNPDYVGLAERRTAQAGLLHSTSSFALAETQFAYQPY